MSAISKTGHDEPDRERKIELDTRKKGVAHEGFDMLCSASKCTLGAPDSLNRQEPPSQRQQGLRL